MKAAMFLRRTLCILFSVSYILTLGLLVVTAVAIDRQYDGGIITTGDDKDYQTLAVNLLYGRGYVSSYILPLTTYNFHTDVTDAAAMEQKAALEGGMISNEIRDFYRAPGLPVMLATTYFIFGNTALNAHLMMVALVGATAFLLLATGASWAGLRGIIVGGFVGLLYLIPWMIRSSPEESVMTEIPAAFLVTLFTFWMVRYGHAARTRTMVALSLTLSALILTRANLLTVFPLILLYFALQRISRKHLVLFICLAAIPVVSWSVFASSRVGKFITLTTQGEIAFPQFNNIDVLDGWEHDRSTQGYWNPGYALGPNGERITTWEYMPEPGESGWAMGFAFWRDHVTDLPRLFLVKLQAGFWTRPPFVPLYWTGMGLILYCMLRRKRPRWLTSSPVWYGAFVLSHLATTLLYGGMRFHEPLDPVLIMLGGFGVVALVERIARAIRNRRSGSRKTAFAA